ncbi:MAG TPA: TPM domain-containing protein [Hyphomicrobiaceae bacterium]|nr:TPM domain-containing protein [Hyphomicrobiaceae bacterium]
MTIVSEMERQRVAEAITQAERQTSGEIVAVIAGESASYAYVPFMWAAIVALAVPFPFIFFTWWPIQHIYGLQLVVFALLVVMLMYRPLRLALVPGAIKRQRAHRRAVEQFLAQNLHTTPNRTGVLIFVSVAERFAEIIADAGINQKVADGTWQSIVDALTRSIGEGEAVDGFVQAIAAVGQELARHFPPGSHDPAAFANHLIVLPSD